MKQLKLKLNRETLRQLTDPELGRVAGGATDGCTWARCPCNTSAPIDIPTEKYDDTCFHCPPETLFC